MADKRKNPREFRSLSELQSEYFPGLDAEKASASAAPRQVGIRLAREALAEIIQKAAAAAQPKTKKGKTAAAPT